MESPLRMDSGSVQLVPEIGLFVAVLIISSFRVSFVVVPDCGPSGGYVRFSSATIISAIRHAQP